MRIQVEFSELSPDEESAVQWRATVRQISLLDRSHYFSLVRQGRDWFRKQTGTDVENELDDPEHVQLRNVVFFRAEILAALPRQMSPDGIGYLAERKVGGEEWQSAFLPENWVSLDGFANDMPVEFLDSLIDATRSLNAGVLSSIPDFLAQSRVKTKFVT